MSSISKLSSWDIFFYYGQNDLDLEIESDLMNLCLQPVRSLYYNNSDSSGVSGYENYPNEFNLQINLRYSIANGVARRNQIISDGSNGYPDRRIAVSQFSISIKQVPNGINIAVLYIPYYNYSSYRIVNTTIGGS